MLTVSALRSSDTQTGFRHVQRIGGQPSRGGSAVYYQARLRHAGVDAGVGPRRERPRAAAQDYCDWRNGLKLEAPATLRVAGHKYETKKIKVPSDIEAARGMIRDWNAQRKGKEGYVYLIIEVLDGGALIYGKIGYSVNPKKRVAELQTGNPRLLKLHALKKGTEADERKLHRKYRELNVLQEWFWLGHVRGKELLLEFDLDHNGDPWGAEEATAA